MLELILVPVGVWVFVMGGLMLPRGIVANTVDRVTKAKYRPDRSTLTLTLDHLKSNPTKWSVSRTEASFPLEGAKSIHIIFSEKFKWQYALSSFGREFVDLEGYFKDEFVREINAEASRREQRSLLRNFYPEVEGTLLLS